MDWYLGCVVEDFVVPSNQEIEDMFPSPNSWSQWEQSSSEAFDSVSKYFVTQANIAGTGVDFNGINENRIGMELFECQNDDYSINSNLCQEFEGSINQDTSSWNVSDYQIDDLDMTNQTNDVFLNSSHDISTDTSTGPYNFYTKFENDDYGVLPPSDSVYENMITASECDPTYVFAMGSSKYLKTHDFSPSVHEGARLYPPSPLKAKNEEVSVSPDFDIMDEDINEEAASEGSVLQELEKTVTQMSDHTRICFRDALYRLAESSEQHSKVSDGNLRSKNVEAETNAVDRAVATLMFYKIDGDVHNLSHCHSSSLGDAEVPIFNLTREVQQDTT